MQRKTLFIISLVVGACFLGTVAFFASSMDDNNLPSTKTQQVVSPSKSSIAPPVSTTPVTVMASIGPTGMSVPVPPVKEPLTKPPSVKGLLVNPSPSKTPSVPKPPATTLPVNALSVKAALPVTAPSVNVSPVKTVSPVKAKAPLVKPSSMQAPSVSIAPAGGVHPLLIPVATTSVPPTRITQKVIVRKVTVMPKQSSTYHTKQVIHYHHHHTKSRVRRKALSSIVTSKSTISYLQPTIPCADYHAPLPLVEKKTNLLQKIQVNYRHPYLTLSGGPAWTNLGNTSLTTSYGITGYSYDASNSGSTVGEYGISVGDELRFPHDIAWQIGLGYMTQNSTNVVGDLNQTIAPTTTTYKYRYTVFTQQWLLDNKIFFTTRKYFHPYAYVGLGESINKTSSVDTSVSPTDTTTLSFPEHTVNSFTYSLGLGVDVDLTQNIRLGAGYRFSHLGETSTAGASIISYGNVTPVAGELKQSSLTTKALLAQLTVIL